MEGTALYLAPELAAGGASSVAGDCWALGCVLYQCLVGRPPVMADTQSEAAARIVQFAAQVCMCVCSRWYVCGVCACAQLSCHSLSCQLVRLHSSDACTVSLPHSPAALVSPAPQELEFPGTVSAAAKDLVLRLLEPTAERRLGGGARGLDVVMDHPFFEGVDAASLYSSTPPPVEYPIPPNPPSSSPPQPRSSRSQQPHTSHCAVCCS